MPDCFSTDTSDPLFTGRVCVEVFECVQIESEISQIKLKSVCQWKPDASRNELYLKQMTNFTKVGVSDRHVELVITASPTYYPPLHPTTTTTPVYRATHLCPVAAASGTAFWVVFEHTYVSSVQKLLRSREYL